jgi:hypothetical protein
MGAGVPCFWGGRTQLACEGTGSREQRFSVKDHRSLVMVSVGLDCEAQPLDAAAGTGPSSIGTFRAPSRCRSSKRPRFSPSLHSSAITHFDM